MRTRWLAAVGIALLGGAASAQPAAPLPPLPPPARDVPCDLPPLLPQPGPAAPLPEVPRPGPGIEYDHGYQYLPERLPERSRRHPTDDGCGPQGRWWVTPSIDLAWAPQQTAPGSVRLRVPNPSGTGTLPGPVLPVGGQDAGRFEAALGLVVGRWFGEGNTQGVEASLFLRDANTTFDGFAPSTVLVVPRGRGRGAEVFVFPAGTGYGASAFPATLGTFFATFDVNYRRNLFCSDGARLDALAGYRYAFLGDELYLGELSEGHDDYRQNRASVSNSFNGGQIGLAGEVRGNGWYAAGSMKLALGAVSSEATATGLFVGAQGAGPNGYRRLNALASAERNEFAVMPALNVQVGRQLTDHARLFTGYTFTYLSRAARLGDALNPAAPALTVTDFWVQSISFGAEFRF